MPSREGFEGKLKNMMKEAHKIRMQERSCSGVGVVWAACPPSVSAETQRFNEPIYAIGGGCAASALLPVTASPPFASPLTSCCSRARGPLALAAAPRAARLRPASDFTDLVRWAGALPRLRHCASSCTLYSSPCSCPRLTCNRLQNRLPRC